MWMSVAVNAYANIANIYKYKYKYKQMPILVHLFSGTIRKKFLRKNI